MAKRSLFNRVRSKVRDNVRDGMNKVMDQVVDFESRGGVRGAYERARVKSERQAEKLFDYLEEKGVKVEFGRWVPETPDERTELSRHFKTLGVTEHAPFAEIKSAYRALMREHHPDRHAGNPDREREATRISQDLTVAYDAIEGHYKRNGKL